jgi:hypothetical protein
LSRQLDKLNNQLKTIAAWRPFFYNPNPRPMPRKPPESPELSLANFWSQVFYIPEFKYKHLYFTEKTDNKRGREQKILQCKNNFGNFLNYMKKKGHILLRNVDDIVRKNYLCQQLLKGNSIVSMILKISCKMNQSET